MVTLEGLLRERIVRLRQELGILESTAAALEELAPAHAQELADEAIPGPAPRPASTSRVPSAGAPTVSNQDRVRIIREALESHGGGWKHRRVLDALLVPGRLSRYQLDTTLRELINVGIVERSGATTSTRYRWKRAQEELEDDDQEGDAT